MKLSSLWENHPRTNITHTLYDRTGMGYIFNGTESEIAEICANIDSTLSHWDKKRCRTSEEHNAQAVAVATAYAPLKERYVGTTFEMEIMGGIL